MTIYHVVLPEDWEAALAAGEYTVSTRGATIAEVGYMHACSSLEQLENVRAAFYADRTDAIPVAMEEAALSAAGLEVRPEPAVSGGTELFPHVYGGNIPIHLMTPFPRD